MYALTFLSGPRKGGKIAVVHGETTLGRGENCGVILSDTKVSRVHCTVHRDGDHLWIEDHGSLNGITVNGNREDRIDLHAGDTVRMGDTVFIVTTADSQIQAFSTGKTVFRPAADKAAGSRPSSRVVAEIDEERGEDAARKDGRARRRWIGRRR